MILGEGFSGVEGARSDIEIREDVFWCVVNSGLVDPILVTNIDGLAVNFPQSTSQIWDTCGSDRTK